MNLDKAALKMALAQSWARKFEDVERAGQRDAHKLEGSIGSLQQAAGALDSHRGYYQAKVDSGDLDGPQCTLAMEVITRCVGGLQNLADKAQLALTLKRGELQGLRRGLDILEKEFKEEQQKVQAVASMVEHDGRPDGAAEDIQRRRAEAKQAGVRAEAPTESQAASKPKRKAKARRRTSRKASP